MILKSSYSSWNQLPTPRGNRFKVFLS